jgi:hypothetical protein
MHCQALSSPLCLHPVENAIGYRKLAQQRQHLFSTFRINKGYPIGIYCKTGPFVAQHIEHD